MRIKHSKFKNTGLIFELLVKQIAADTLNNQDSPAISILKKYYTGKTALVREFKLYEFVTKNRGISQSKAETILSTIIEVSRKLDSTTLKNQKYDLISEIKESYNIDEFFSIKVGNYKALASLYCLLESHKAADIVDPSFIINNKVTLLEHLTSSKQNKEEVKDTIIEEYSKYPKDLKLLTFKILLEKFNSKYKDLLPEQKRILKEFITAVDSSAKLRSLVNEELNNISQEISNLIENVKDDVVKIKLTEVLKNINPIGKTQKVTDNNLVDIMQYYDLVAELRTI